jgi:hypothetical protein
MTTSGDHPPIPQHHATRAQRYGIDHYPKLMRDMLLFIIGIKEDGLAATMRSARTIVLLRLHMKLHDLAFMRKMKKPLYGERALQGMTLTASSAEEASGGTHCSPMPAKIQQWALEELGIDPRGFSFLDVGSGWGYNLLRAAEHDFRSLTGVEYAKELDDAAQINIADAIATNLVPNHAITAVHDSALNLTLPTGNLVLCLFHPFDAAVMRQFMHHVHTQGLAGRDVCLIYVNAVEHEAIDASGVFERVPLSLGFRLKMALLSPFSVILYRSKGQGA